MNIHAQIHSVKKAGMLAQNTFRGTHSSSLAASSDIAIVHRYKSTTRFRPPTEVPTTPKTTLLLLQFLSRRHDAQDAERRHSSLERPHLGQKTRRWNGSPRSTRHDAATDLRGRRPFARLHALIYSQPLSERNERTTYIKMDNRQPSGLV